MMTCEEDMMMNGGTTHPDNHSPTRKALERSFFAFIFVLAIVTEGAPSMMKGIGASATSMKESLPDIAHKIPQLERYCWFTTRHYHWNSPDDHHPVPFAPAPVTNSPQPNEDWWEATHLFDDDGKMTILGEYYRQL